MISTINFCCFCSSGLRACLQLTLKSAQLCVFFSWFEKVEQPLQNSFFQSLRFRAICQPLLRGLNLCCPKVGSFTPQERLRPRTFAISYRSPQPPSANPIFPFSFFFSFAFYSFICSFPNLLRQRLCHVVRYIRKWRCGSQISGTKSQT